MAVLFIPLWKEAPFTRLLLPFIIGIILGYYFDAHVNYLFPLISACFFFLIFFSFFRLSFKFRYPWVFGLLINLLLIAMGMLIMHLNKVKPLSLKPPFVVSIEAPLSDKPKTWKATGSDNISIYFRKDSVLAKPAYGDKIFFIKIPEKISDNYYRVFLKPREFIVLEEKEINSFKVFLFAIQDWVLAVLQKYIPGKKECGLAEALLIGYKNDLDRELMKAYSNTGVVHVIAISGLHLGLIYMLLKYLCYPFSRKRFGRWLTPLIVIASLWVFSLLVGGSPSVMRSAVMFTFIVAGECFSKTTSIYNNLAASAFFLLCYQPNWLWDIGFQLSYGALLSIVIFQKTIYNLLVFKNKIADAIWKLNSVTIAAQILTTPICIYYFNQFPNLFLITNFIAVPLSSIILIGEILLCTISSFTLLALPLGRALSFSLKLMNDSVEFLGSFSFSTTTNLQINFLQLIILYCLIGISWNLILGRGIKKGLKN